MSRAADEMRERAQKLGLKRLAALREKADAKQGEVHRLVQCGWSFAISVNDYGTRAPDGSDRYHVSAMLVPEGRGSEKHDWHFLGQAIGVLTRMSEPLAPVTPIETTHPNAVHHWTWTPTRYDVATEAKKSLAVLHPDLAAPPEGRSALWRAAQRIVGFLGAKREKSTSEREAEADVRRKADQLWSDMTEEERAACAPPREPGEAARRQGDLTWLTSTTSQTTAIARASAIRASTARSVRPSQTLRKTGEYGTGARTGTTRVEPSSASSRPR